MPFVVDVILRISIRRSMKISICDEWFCRHDREIGVDRRFAEMTIEMTIEICSAKYCGYFGQ